MAEEHLRAKRQYSRELELISTQRQHFKPGRTDETAYQDDEVAVWRPRSSRFLDTGRGQRMAPANQPRSLATHDKAQHPSATNAKMRRRPFRTPLRANKSSATAKHTKDPS